MCRLLFAQLKKKEGNLMEKKLNIRYMMSNFFYFSMFASMMAFVSVYLLHKGFDNATIGTVLSVTSVSSIVFQTWLANFVDKRKNLRVQDVVTFIVAVIVGGSLVLYFMPAEIGIIAIVVVIFALSQSLTALLNSLAFIYERFGININYGVARGTGSAAYAITTMLLGYVVDATSPDLLPLFYATFGILIIVSVRSFFLPEDQRVVVQEVDEPLEEQVAADQTLIEFIGKYKRLVLLMGGVVFLFFAHTIINNFFIQIITPIGGDSASMGTAIFIGAMVELPAMMNFNQISKKIPVSRLLIISAVFFLAKHTLTFFAPNIFVIYLAQALQIGAFAVAYPALVAYINSIVDLKDLVKGQSLLTIAMALSSVFASFLGGVLLDSIGTSQTLLLGVVTTAIGLVIIIFTVEDTSEFARTIKA